MTRIESPDLRTDVQVFTTATVSGSSVYTWTKPTGGLFVTVTLIGGGGGGGGGRRGATGTYRGGGYGGGGAAWNELSFPASSLPDTVTVTVGGGGTGALAVTADNTNGSTGGDGVDTTFGTLLRAYCGYGGPGGSNFSTQSFVGNPSPSMIPADPARGYDSIDAVFLGCPAGGPGGLIGGTTANSVATSYTTDIAYGGLVGHVSPMVNTTLGQSGPGESGPSSPAGTYWPGTAGGGGSPAGPRAGGAGGNYGAGGGGGAGSTNGTASGAGGNGGHGVAVIVTYF